MSLGFLLIFMIFVWFDFFILKKINHFLTASFFLPSKKILCLLGVFFLLVFVSANDLSGMFSVFIVVLLPLYVFKRFKIKNNNRNEDSPENPKLLLLSEALGVVIYWFFGMLVLSLLVKGLSWFFPVFVSEYPLTFPE